MMADDGTKPMHLFGKWQRLSRHFVEDQRNSVLNPHGRCTLLLQTPDVQLSIWAGLDRHEGSITMRLLIAPMQDT